MAERRIYTAALASVVALTGDNTAHPLGIVANVSATKTFDIENVPEWGSYKHAAMLMHHYEATFSWGQAWSEGLDLVAEGLVPSAAEIAQFRPFYLVIIDTLSQRNILKIDQALIDTYTVGGDARAKLMSNISGRALDMLFESELS